MNFIPVERLAFIVDLENTLNPDGARTSGCTGILMLDLVRFARLNMLYGYEAGDLLISQIMDRLQTRMKPHGAIIKRIGNDEFGVILPNLPNRDMLLLALNKVVRIFSEKFFIKEQQLALDVQIGAAQAPEHGLDPDALMLAAEQALLEAKRSRKTSVIWADKGKSELEQQWDIEQELKEAIHRNELELYFQPKLNLKTGCPTHPEALLRWNSAAYGRVPPNIFIPVAENSGLMDSLTRWILNTALRLSREWPDNWGALSVAVNISASNLHCQDLQEMIQSALRIWSKRPEDLTLEITESAIMQDKQAAFGNLSLIRENGVKVSIDDFGTGYSSLEYFKQIPANELKIDQSFVFNMLRDEADQKLVELIIDLAHKFGLIVVAEGVEDEETLRYLIRMGCDYAQGFHIARPMPQDQLIDWLLHYDAKKYLQAGSC